LRIFSQPAATDSTKTELVGEAFVTPTAAQAAAQKSRATAAPVDAAGAAPSPRLVDLLLGALTGHPGGFASQMTYAERVGRWRRVFTIDSDGFDLRAIGPDSATALSPL